MTLHYKGTQLTECGDAYGTDVHLITVEIDPITPNDYNPFVFSADELAPYEPLIMEVYTKYVLPDENGTVFVDICTQSGEYIGSWELTDEIIEDYWGYWADNPVYKAMEESL